MDVSVPVEGERPGFRLVASDSVGVVLAMKVGQFTIALNPNEAETMTVVKLSVG